jgi:hypothetical protein
MNRTLSRAASALGSALALSLPTAASTPSNEALIDSALLTMQDEPESWVGAVRQGTASVEFRTRYQNIDDDAFTFNTHALTIRTNVRFRTAEYDGLYAVIDFQDTSSMAEGIFSILDAPRVEIRPTPA